MKELIELITTSLVDNPDNVTIDINDELQIIHIYVDKSEIGRIIGKQGRIAKAIRAIVKASCSKNHTKYMVEIDER